MKKIIFLFLLIVTLQVKAQMDPLQTKDSIAQINWVNDVMSKMTIDQKIGQLFMVAAYSNRDAEHERFISNLINVRTFLVYNGKSAFCIQL